jgi:hypothetical protein
MTHHDIPCPYCKKYGKENILEYIPDRLQYYCKRCEYKYSEDTINAEQPKHRTAKAKAPEKKKVFPHVSQYKEEPVKVEKVGEPKTVDTRKLISKKA